MTPSLCVLNWSVLVQIQISPEYDNLRMALGTIQIGNDTLICWVWKIFDTVTMDVHYRYPHPISISARYNLLTDPPANTRTACYWNPDGYTNNGQHASGLIKSITLR